MAPTTVKVSKTNKEEEEANKGTFITVSQEAFSSSYDLIQLPFTTKSDFTFNNSQIEFTDREVRNYLNQMPFMSLIDDQEPDKSNQSNETLASFAKSKDFKLPPPRPLILKKVG